MAVDGADSQHSGSIQSEKEEDAELESEDEADDSDIESESEDDDDYLDAIEELRNYAKPVTTNDPASTTVGDATRTATANTQLPNMAAVATSTAPLAQAVAQAVSAVATLHFEAETDPRKLLNAFFRFRAINGSNMCMVSVRQLLNWTRSCDQTINKRTANFRKIRESFQYIYNGIHSDSKSYTAFSFPMRPTNNTPDHRGYVAFCDNYFENRLIRKRACYSLSVKCSGDEKNQYTIIITSNKADDKFVSSYVVCNFDSDYNTFDWMPSGELYRSVNNTVTFPAVVHTEFHKALNKNGNYQLIVFTADDIIAKSQTEKRPNYVSFISECRSSYPRVSVVVWCCEVR